MKYLLIWLAVINLLAFIITAADKRAAENHRWRVPERTLLTIAFFGGAAGEWAAMLLCRHKTKKARFCVGVPLMLLMHIVLLGYLIFFKEMSL